jgi:hypothetical protein
MGAGPVEKQIESLFLQALPQLGERLANFVSKCEIM